MKIVTGAEMRRIDEATISRFVTGVALMERAGQRVFEQIESIVPVARVPRRVDIPRAREQRRRRPRRRAAPRGKGREGDPPLPAPARGVLPGRGEEPRAARLAPRRARRSSSIFLYLAGWQELARKALEDSDLIVDALLGTGLNKAVGEEYAAVIDVMNESELPIVSVDIPSGVNADTGEIMGDAVVADATVTMGLPKIGCLFYPGKGCAGDLVVGDIGDSARGDRRAGDRGARRSISSARSRIFPCGSRRRTSSRAARSSSSRGAAATRARRFSPRSRRSEPAAASSTARARNRSAPSSRGPRPK